MPERYFLLKRGYFYRPNSKGYTANILEAGVYDEGDVAPYKAVPERGVTIIPVAEMRDDMQQKIAQANETILAAQLGLEMIDQVASMGDEERDVHEMMRDPRYWRDRDPKFVEEVTLRFREIFEQETPNA